MGLFHGRESRTAPSFHVAEGLPSPEAFAPLFLGLWVHLPWSWLGMDRGLGQVLSRACKCPGKGERQERNPAFTDFLLCVGQAETR